MLNAARTLEMEMASRSRSYSGVGRQDSRFGSSGQAQGKTHSYGEKSNLGMDWNFGRGVKSNVGGGTSTGPGPKNEMGDKGKTGPRDRGVRHLSYQELLDRRQKGLCFKCGGTYHPSHMCPDKQIRIMILEEGNQGNEGEFDNSPHDGDEIDDDVVEGKCSVLSLQSLVEDKSTQSYTLKLRGKIKEVPILILVDSRATHNFISQKLVESLDWEYENARSMKVLMGDGHLTRTQGLCRDLEMELEGGNFTVDAYLFELQDIDMILGVSWLASFGEMLVDWRDHIMKIQTPEGVRILKGVRHGPTALNVMIEDKSEAQGRDASELSPKQSEEL
ncbi:Aspartic peptidase domain superfamily [Sesbania bispinosa]|nr:Aspartic peptidase domain superfamily [Sesbania bispinosa]